MSESKEEMTVNVPDEALQAFKDLKLRRKLRYIVYTVADRWIQRVPAGPPLARSLTHFVGRTTLRSHAQDCDGGKYGTTVGVVCAPAGQAAAHCMPVRCGQPACFAGPHRRTLAQIRHS